MSQPSAKEIAERIINDPHSIGGSIDFYRASEILARAYLELEKELVHYKNEWQALRNEIRDKLYESPGFRDFHTRTVDRLNSEIAKLREENAQLSKYCGEVRYWQNRAEDLSEELERMRNKEDT